MAVLSVGSLIIQAGFVKAGPGMGNEQENA